MKSLHTLVLGMDFDEASMIGFRSTIELCRGLSVQHLFIVHGGGSPSFTDRLSDSHARVLATAQERIDKLDTSDLTDTQVHRVVRSGSPSRVVVEVAEENGADFIVLSSHGYGSIRRSFLGSVTSDVLRASPVPVLVLGRGRPLAWPPPRVTIAIDLSPVSQDVLISALRLFDAPDTVRLATVAVDPVLDQDDVGGPSGADENLKQAVRDAIANELKRISLPYEGIRFETAVLEDGPPPDALLFDLEAHPASMLVLGTSGHSTWERFVLGSTADRLAAEAPVPVLVIPTGGSSAA
jgi:nucleotide-binding universal stress UspA family protein